MPTTSRRLPWIPQAIEAWRNQSYPPSSRELLAVSEDDLASAIPDDVRFLRLNGAYTIGTKRNVACENASGEIICHWDDDNWSHPLRIEEQVAALNGHDLTGYCSLPFVDLHTGQVWRWSGHNEICGTSMCYTRQHWQSQPFKDIQIAEDVTFYKMTQNKTTVPGDTRMVARFHSDSVTRSTAKFAGGGWSAGTWADLPEGFPR